ncbi:gliding motility-associated lipoprotein GldD [Candidatus Ornithobacterium hominis]|uniref:Gliding motility-associated lipoprotein GldD n=1 Tax=Candidatus Ornithobacterium hominis TaxID=2497989 RepID=A0A383U0U7_9FLAO|nr:gliding motility lipoprotein GldD [Candidatus Ornithobacterium hominis]MCT7904957.1 gliding motility lipoprotein GldD [Candidatus Ornithobacterium hominis]SZD73360.1 gliding motility-associated lipoprotein GldD [Candidatus Ornithobacterium hominis]SZD73464.1 gliding motility-associated lipoprotein GldD [Candidatus Ornithobacterium hominis]
MKVTINFICFFLSLIFFSCSRGKELPKPFGHLRLAYAEPRFSNFEKPCAFKFQVADFSQIKNKERNCSFDIYYPRLKATIYLTYEPINQNLNALIDDAEKSVYEPHTSRASYIKPQLIIRPNEKVYGTLYELGGNAALNYQFHLTDSTQHFLRGALYFNAYPNPDSLAPAKDYMLKNIQHLMETLEWK